MLKFICPNKFFDNIITAENLSQDKKIFQSQQWEHSKKAAQHILNVTSEVTSTDVTRHLSYQ